MSATPEQRRKNRQHNNEQSLLSVRNNIEVAWELIEQDFDEAGMLADHWEQAHE